MAWLFSLSVECGDSSSAAVAIGEDLAPRIDARTHRRTFSDDDGGQWISLFVDDIDTEDSAAVEALAHQLRVLLAETSLRFRFGLAGVEVDEARTWPELVEDVQGTSLFEGVVLNIEVWEQLGRPPQFISLGRHVVSSTAPPGDREA